MRRRERRLIARKELSMKKEERKLLDRDFDLAETMFFSVLVLGKSCVCPTTLAVRSVSATEVSREAADEVGDETEGVDELSLVST